MKPGDVVALKSGGHLMVISKIDEEGKIAECLYFPNRATEYADVCVGAAFPIITLRKAK